MLQEVALGAVSHNLNGQKLGRKGRITRDRILAAATLEILDGTASLSSVARRAELGMTSIYNYFSDMTQLLLAVLEPIMAEADVAYLDYLRVRWPDNEIAARAEEFVRRYQRFWARNSAALHLRNSMADMRNERMMHHRVDATKPVIRALVVQMDADPDGPDSPELAMASFLMTGLERAVTVNTDSYLDAVVGLAGSNRPERYLAPPAQVFDLVLREIRARRGVAAVCARGGASQEGSET